MTESGQPFLVLEYVEGTRIDRYACEHRLDVAARLELFLQVADAVAHAHANLVVHRDLKPSNVLVDADGQVKLLDFGIATLVASGAADTKTVTLGGALTPQYAAPEQVAGGPVTTATDVYALGVLLYQMLVGRHPTAPPGEASHAAVLAALTTQEPPRPSDVVSQLAASDPESQRILHEWSSSRDCLRRAYRGDLDTIVAKALKKEPAERYQTVTGLVDDIRRHLRHEPIAARPDSRAYRGAKFVRRHRVVVMLASLVLAAIAAGVVGTVSQAGRATAQASRADEEARSASAQRDFALKQLARAEAINELNSFVLSEGSKLGDWFTVEELMARAERVVEREQGTATENRVELLHSIGYQDQNLDYHAKAREVFTRTYELARTSADGATRAKAACALASTLGQAGQGERAEQLLRTAEDDLPDGPQFALHRVVLPRDGQPHRRRAGRWAGCDRARRSGTANAESLTLRFSADGPAYLGDSRSLLCLRRPAA